MEESERQGRAAEQGAPRWDLTGMSSAYCNIATATATRDSVVLHLGVKHGAGERLPAELSPELLHRIALSPAAAKQLHAILARLLGEYDAQRGA